MIEPTDQYATPRRCGMRRPMRWNSPPEQIRLAASMMMTVVGSMVRGGIIEARSAPWHTGPHRASYGGLHIGHEFTPVPGRQP
jgi:hypothetical protein